MTRPYWIAVFTREGEPTAHYPRLSRGWADRDARDEGIVVRVDPINGATHDGEPFHGPAGLLPPPPPRRYAAYLDPSDLALVAAWAAVRGRDRTSGTVRRKMRDLALDHGEREAIVAELALAVVREVTS